MPTYRTPDVYVEEISVFPPSVAEVGTAIPAFIGYTEKATRGTESLTLKPTKIYSLKEYETHFGFPKLEAIQVKVKVDATGVSLDTFTAPTAKYSMYYAVQMYYANGGGQCYIVSVGAYADAQASADLKEGIDQLAKEDEPTLVVVPEAVNLTATGYDDVVQAVLLQCGTLKDRFGIFDLPESTDALFTGTGLADSRGRFGNNHLKYGAAYYPFLKSSIPHHVSEETATDNVDVVIDAAAAVKLSSLRNANTAVFNFVRAELANHQVVVPPSGAVAGVYAAVDAARGVWKAPANVSLANVVEPTVKLDNTKQDLLNVDADSGKSINALRAFAARGTLVWGARTLAGNDNEWRYINVRRFFNMVEESVKKSTYWAVFEPNDANTWVKVRGMIENYLTDKWREGALAGATPKDAYFVRCGLGSTMTAQDILQGKMNVEIGMAVVRPAEFIVLKFSHKLQTS